MVTPDPYLAAENSALLRRYRALHRSLVVAPCAVVLSVGLVGHVHGRPHVQPAGSSDYDRRVLAYRDRVAETQDLLKHGGSPADLEREARAWTAGFASGDLTALTPACYEDHLRDGPRGEVLRTGLTLSSELSQEAEETIQKGGYVAGARDAILSAELARGLRGFETQAFVQSLLTARRGLVAANRAWPHLPEPKRASLRSRLQGLLVDPPEYKELRQVETNNVDAYRARQGTVVDETSMAVAFTGNAKASIDSALDHSLRQNNARVLRLLDDEPKTKG